MSHKTAELFTCNDKSDAGGIPRWNKKRCQKCVLLYFVALLIVAGVYICFDIRFVPEVLKGKINGNEYFLNLIFYFIYIDIFHNK